MTAGRKAKGRKGGRKGDLPSRADRFAGRLAGYKGLQRLPSNKLQHTKEVRWEIMTQGVKKG